MADFSVVEYQGRLLCPEDTVTFRARDRAWLESELAMAHPGPTVVVTHHLPRLTSIAPKFAKSRLNPAFCSDLEELIQRYQPEVWAHGHTHDPFDYRAGKTRIVCNLLGYPGERPDPFNNGLILEID